MKLRTFRYPAFCARPFAMSAAPALAWWQFVAYSPNGDRKVLPPYATEKACQAALKQADAELAKRYPSFIRASAAARNTAERTFRAPFASRSTKCASAAVICLAVNFGRTVKTNHARSLYVRARKALSHWSEYRLGGPPRLVQLCGVWLFRTS